MIQIILEAKFLSEQAKKIYLYEWDYAHLPRTGESIDIGTILDMPPLKSYLWTV